jgi:hypothetical protein
METELEELSRTVEDGKAATQELRSCLEELWSMIRKAEARYLEEEDD